MSAVEVVRFTAKSLTILDTYQDSGSRDLAHKRPGFQALLQKVRNNEVDFIVVAERDRFGAADVVEYHSFIHLLRTHRCKLYSAADDTELTGSVSRIEPFMAVITSDRSRSEQEARGQREHRSKMAHVKRGAWSGGRPPYGYDLVCREDSTNRELWRLVYDPGQHLRVCHYPDGTTRRFDGKHNVPAHNRGETVFAEVSKDVVMVGWVRKIFKWFRDGLTYRGILTDAVIADALATVGHWLDRIFSPLVTLWVFLGQVLSPDHSCRAAVARLLAHRAAHGQVPCSARTGAYCRARQRLPEEFFSAAACAVGRGLDARSDRGWRWKGRRVYLFDGTTVTMPDSPANQAAYPQVYNQGPGVGFPIARLGAVISLACGSVVNLGFSRYAGKGEGEVSLLRRLWDALRPGDVLVGDRLMSGWAGMHLLKERGVDTVSRLSAHRRADFRKGTRLGKDDHLVVWTKPTSIRSLDRSTYNALPDSITVREARFRVAQPGFRIRSVVVVTTLLDPEQTTKEELAEVYRARWNNELDLRSLKSTMQMAELRSKTPEVVRKEVWAHVLAYNLIRTVMAQAAARHEVPPRSISFKGAMQTLEAFEPLLALGPARDTAGRRDLYREVLDAIATHRVADRPDRFEPRLKKRRKDYCGWFTKPRAEVKRMMAKGIYEK